jgi:hypothetical protein
MPQSAPNLKAHPVANERNHNIEELKPMASQALQSN